MLDNFVKNVDIDLEILKNGGNCQKKLGIKNVKS